MTDQMTRTSQLGRVGRRAWFGAIGVSILFVVVYATVSAFVALAIAAVGAFTPRVRDAPWGIAVAMLWVLIVLWILLTRAPIWA